MVSQPMHAKQLKSINSKHRIMMNRLMLGDKATDIAKDLHMSDSTFSVIRNSPLFKAELDRMQRVARYNIINTANEVSEIINVAAPLAARKVVELVDHENENVALRAAEKVIDYSDFGIRREEAVAKPIVITQQQMVLIEEGMQDVPAQQMQEG